MTMLKEPNTLHVPPLKNFPYGVYLESGVPVYVQRSSEELLKHICDMENKHDEKCLDDLEVYLKYYEHYYSVHEYDQRTFFFVSSERLLAKDLKSIKALFRYIYICKPIYFISPYIK